MKKKEVAPVKKTTKVIAKQARNYRSMSSEHKRMCILMPYNAKGERLGIVKSIRKFFCTIDLPRAMMEYDVKPNRAVN